MIKALMIAAIAATTMACAHAQQPSQIVDMEAMMRDARAHKGIDENGHQKYEDGLNGWRGPMSGKDRYCRKQESTAAHSYLARVEGRTVYKFPPSDNPKFRHIDEFVQKAWMEGTSEEQVRLAVRDYCLSNLTNKGWTGRD